MNELNYENDVKIDSTALDLEWLQQSELMYKYAYHAAETKKEVDEAKERLEIGKARIEMDIRSTPGAYGLEKITEGAVQSTLLLQPDYETLTKEFIQAKYENEVALAAVRAIDQRKTALENLVRLLMASYFAGPQSPRDLQQEVLKEKERKTANAKIKIKRRTQEEE